MSQLFTNSNSKTTYFDASGLLIQYFGHLGWLETPQMYPLHYLSTTFQYRSLHQHTTPYNPILLPAGNSRKFQDTQNIISLMIRDMITQSHQSTKRSLGQAYIQTDSWAKSIISSNCFFVLFSAICLETFLNYKTYYHLKLLYFRREKKIQKDSGHIVTI